MPKIDLYSMAWCPWCNKAKALLDKRGVKYKEIEVDYDDDAAWDDLYKRSGLKTVPQIYIDEKPLGGYHELVAQDEKDELKSLK